MNDLQNLRFECLRLALDNRFGPGDVVEAARKYTDFVLGKNDAEVIRAASELAKTVQPKP